MSKRRANTESEAKAWKTAEERSKEKCTWLTKKERDENLAALKRMEDLMLCLNIKPDKPENPVKERKHPLLKEEKEIKHITDMIEKSGIKLSEINITDKEFYRYKSLWN